MKSLQISTYTDESGQDTQGKVFVVCTIIIPSEASDNIEKVLNEIEQQSGKIQKWYASGDHKRHAYTDLLVKTKILNKIEIIYSKYINKKDYIQLTAAHIAKAILLFAKSEKYTAKVFIDKMDKRTLSLIQKEIKLFHIQYKKIRGLSDDSNSLIRLADAICGMLRDLNKKNKTEAYTKIFSQMKEV
jgi:hypothetical protein